MKLTIGCPVKDRNWILPYWFQHISVAGGEFVAKANQSLDIQFIFVVGSDDFETQKFLSKYPNTKIVLAEEKNTPYERAWNQSRYDHMVYLRNLLLSEVRKHNQDYFLSLDSDILLDQRSLISLIATAEAYPTVSAVGQKCYLSTTDRLHPNMGFWSNAQYRNFYRRDVDTPTLVDILMALKLMREDAWNVDYETHVHGEDLGWSLAVSRANLRVMFDGSVTNKHVMNQAMLHEEDPRLGW